MESRGDHGTFHSQRSCFFFRYTVENVTAANIGETRVRDLPRFIVKNVCVIVTVGSAYRAN